MTIPRRGQTLPRHRWRVGSCACAPEPASHPRGMKGDATFEGQFVEAASRDIPRATPAWVCMAGGFWRFQHRDFVSPGYGGIHPHAGRVSPASWFPRGGGGVSQETWIRCLARDVGVRFCRPLRDSAFWLRRFPRAEGPAYVQSGQEGRPDRAVPVWADQQARDVFPKCHFRKKTASGAHPTCRAGAIRWLKCTSSLLPLNSNPIPIPCSPSSSLQSWLPPAIRSSTSSLGAASAVRSSSSSLRKCSASNPPPFSATPSRTPFP